MRRLVQRVRQVEPEVPVVRLVEQRPEQQVVVRPGAAQQAVPLEAQRVVQQAQVQRVPVRPPEQRQVQQRQAHLRQWLVRSRVLALSVR